MKIHRLCTVLAAGAALFACATVIFAGDAPKAGDKAPLIEGKDPDGRNWKLADALEKNVVLLYFYPKDNTPGCTVEACSLRDRMSDLQKDGVIVVGVSFDDAASHKKFIADHHLNFLLLTDTDGKIADAFGARMPGKNMARRISFLIGKNGRILHVTDSSKVDPHIEEMKEAVEKLKKS